MQLSECRQMVCLRFFQAFVGTSTASTRHLVLVRSVRLTRQPGLCSHTLQPFPLPPHAEHAFCEPDAYPKFGAFSVLSAARSVFADPWTAWAVHFAS
mmetsp:Transcript_37756/g.83123  ORF Transcript_37756/g.83123 Transcript_37756/m.83123 type:complete len:97 (+) Transcript_37756:993-1283(+)